MKPGALIVLFLTLGLAACGGGHHYVASGAGAYKVGKPYKVNGVWYRPTADPYYDRVGIASWYGRDFHGKRTANGEKYNMNSMTAAHTTLPLPSYVLVTNLQNGRKAVLRVNDRGPFAKGRIIDVSRRAAQVLGFEKSGIARVRVQAYPLREPPHSKPQLMARSDTDTRWVQNEVLNSNGSLFVQAGAFSSRSGAEHLRSELSRFGNATVSRVKVDGRPLYRVRLGPLASPRQADDLLSRVIALGHSAARVVAECSRNC